MLPYSMIAGGTFTSTLSTPQTLTLQSESPPDYFVMRNLGASASTGWGELGDAQNIEWFWERSMSQGTAKGIRQSSDGANPAMIAAFTSTDGISCYDLINPPGFAALACTAVARGAAGGVSVVSMADTGTISVGDTVTLYNVAGMQQISGKDFQVVAVTANVSITISLDSSDFAADGTTGQVVKYIAWRFYPRYNWITGISKATQCVVDVTIDSQFTVGEMVSFRVPTGITTMSEIQNAQGVVVSVTPSTATTCAKVTVDIDTSGYTTFALPTSAQTAAGVSNFQAMLVPAGSGPIPSANPPAMNINGAFDNRNTRVIQLGATLFATGTTGDVWQWMAYKYDQYNGS
jgi:hypothetical protein